jgi:hypothetical protein
MSSVMTQNIPSFGEDLEPFICGLLNSINTSVRFGKSRSGFVCVTLKVGAGTTAIGTTAAPESAS